MIVIKWYVVPLKNQPIIVIKRNLELLHNKLLTVLNQNRIFYVNYRHDSPLNKSCTHPQRPMTIFRTNLAHQQETDITQTKSCSHIKKGRSAP